MRVIFVLYDSLVRGAMQNYGGTHIDTPNFLRFAERAVTFDSHFVGSLPCMPARREMHTGRYNFLHRSWGALEPFDQSFSELLRASGVYTHLISDHYHYWEDGGATYHGRYASHEFIRGQESDAWKAMVEPPWERLKAQYHAVQNDSDPAGKFYHYMINREFMSKAEEDFTAVQCFSHGLDFLDTNRSADDWFLQIETFDPHEPFFAPERYREDYPTNYAGPILDWPPYERVNEAPDECAELRANYCAIVALCDAQMGRLLDYFDAHDLWRDTALVVSTDHGFLLGEHDWWAKLRMPCYEEVAHIPLMIHHPAHREMAGTRRRALTQTMDLMPTFLDLHGLAPPPEVQGHSLLPLLGEDIDLREAAIFGVFGSATNITDGRYTYFRYPRDMDEQDIYQYTLMTTQLKSRFPLAPLREATLAPPFGFSKGVPLLRIPTQPKRHPAAGQFLAPGFMQDADTVLYDLESDPMQNTPIQAPAVEARLEQLMAQLMRETEAPSEAFSRLALSG
ncbi:MAG: sulfatase [Gammaproteobacteria bacterium]